MRARYRTNVGMREGTILKNNKYTIWVTIRTESKIKHIKRKKSRDKVETYQ